jgi:hypothetical protein
MAPNLIIILANFGLKIKKKPERASKNWALKRTRNTFLSQVDDIKSQPG